MASPVSAHGCKFTCGPSAERCSDVHIRRRWRGRCRLHMLPLLPKLSLLLLTLLLLPPLLLLLPLPLVLRLPL